MKKNIQKFILAFLYSFILLSGLYLVFHLSIRWWKGNEQTNIKTAWQLVPHKAGLILEIQNLTLFKKHLDSLVFWEELQNISDIQQFEQKLELLSKLSDVLPQKDNEPILLISTPISQKEWGTTLIFPIYKTEDFSIENLFDPYKKYLSTFKEEEDSYSLEISDEREFLHQPLTEWKIQNGEFALTLYLIEQYLLVSFSSQALEEVIRDIINDNQQKISNKKIENCHFKKDLSLSKFALYIQPKICLDWLKKTNSIHKLDNELIEKYSSLPTLSFLFSLNQNLLVGENFCEDFSNHQKIVEELKGTVEFEKDWKKIISYFPETWKSHILEETSIWKNFQEMSWSFSSQMSDFQIKYDVLRATTLPKIRLLKDQWWKKEIQQMKVFPTATHTLFLIQDEQGIHALTPYSIITRKPLVLWSISSTDSLEKWVNILKIQGNFWAASTRKLYKISEKGKLENNFPIQLPDSFAIEYFQAFQSNKKEVHFLGIDSLGKALMVNEKGKIFEGWNQRSLFRKLNQIPEYLKVGQKEGILTIAGDGWIHFLQLNGKPFKGFPMILNEYLTENSVIEKGSSLENTTITMLTKKGELLKINLKGELIERKKPYQPKGEANFNIVKEENKGNSWKMTCQDDTEMLVFEGDESNKLVFQETFGVIAPSEIQFFQMDENHTFYVLRDEISEETHIYKQGEGKIGIQGIKNNKPIWILNDNSAQRFLLLTAYKHHVCLWSLPKG